jgi:hypothetical protein
MFFETPKTPAHSAYCLANPLGGKNYSARRKRNAAQAKLLRIPYLHLLLGSVRPPIGHPHIFWRGKKFPSSRTTISWGVHR